MPTFVAYIIFLLDSAVLEGNQTYKQMCSMMSGEEILGLRSDRNETVSKQVEINLWAWDSVEANVARAGERGV